mgnify:CR=1 FL=1
MAILENGKGDEHLWNIIPDCIIAIINIWHQVFKSTWDGKIWSGMKHGFHLKKMNAQYLLALLNCYVFAITKKEPS